MPPPSKKTIAFVANTAWSLWQFRGTVIRTLLETGYRVVCIAPRDRFSDRLAGIGCRCLHIPIKAKGTNPLDDLRLLFGYLRLYRKLRPDLVFHYTIKPNIYGTLAASFCGVRSIAVTTGLGYTFINANWVSNVAEKLYRIALRRTEQVWFLNKDDRDAFVEKGLVSANHVHVLPGEGIDTQAYAYAMPPSPPSDVVLFIGRLLSDKGVHEFVDVARRFRERRRPNRFVMAGAVDAENPAAISREQIADWVAEGVVEYLGALDDVRALIASARCVVLPSYREGVPRVLLEALAMGRPVVATDVPGCRDVVIDGETGFLCASRDADDLERALQRLLSLSPPDYTAMSRRGREFVERQFSDGVVLQHYRHVLDRLE